MKNHRNERPRHGHAPPPAKAPRPAGSEEVVLGLRAGLAVFARRPDDVLRVAYARETREEVHALAAWADAHDVPCEELHEADLDAIADGPHHEGLCVLSRPRAWASAQELATLLVQKKGTALALDRVRNPYNVGAILRSAAFFGIDAVLLGTPAPHPGLPPMAVRVAEGGAESVTLARTTDLADTLSRLRARGVKVTGADGASDARAAGFDFGRPAVLVMGNEREGLGERVRAQCDAIVAIAGTGAVESLNVAVASGVLIAELVRSRGTRPAR